MIKQNYIYGANPVMECIKANTYKIDHIFLLNLNNQKLMNLINKYNIKYFIKQKNELDKLCETPKHQGVIAFISNWKTYSLEEIVKKAKIKEAKPLFIILDQIEDPHNFGAIIRISDLFNVSGIIILSVRQSQLNPIVAKVSSGGFNYVSVCVVKNLTNAIKYLKDNGFWIYSTSFSEKSVPFDSLNYDTPTVLILGNENKGVSKRLLNESDYQIHIPTNGHIDSLNVSCATSILVYEIWKQLHQ